MNKILIVEASESDRRDNGGCKGRGGKTATRRSD